MEVYSGFGEYYRPRDRPVVRCHRRHGPARQHADLLHHRRQRDERRGRHVRHVQRDDVLQRRRRDGPGDAQALRRLGRPGHLSAHGGGLGRRRRHAVHVDQADSLQLRRHPQRHDRLVAQAHQSREPDSFAVAPRHRRGAHRARSREPARAQERQRRRAGADRRREHGLHVRQGGRAEHAQDPVLRDHGQSRHLRRRLVCRHHSPRTVGAEAPPQAAGGHLGALRHAQRLQPGQRPGRGESGEAQGAAGPLHEGGDQLSRAAHR